MDLKNFLGMDTECKNNESRNSVSKQKYKDLKKCVSECRAAPPSQNLWWTRENKVETVTSSLQHSDMKRAIIITM